MDKRFEMATQNGRAMRKPVFSHVRHLLLQNVWMESKGPDDTMRMRKMIWICTLCTYSKDAFTLRGPNNASPKTD